MSKTGSNSGVASDQLRSIVERVERLEEEKKSIADDIKEIYAEAKGNGFDPKTIKEIVKLRALDANERAEREALLDIYKAALGMLGDTPLGAAALDRLTRRPERRDHPPAKPASDAPADMDAAFATKPAEKPKEEPAPDHPGPTIEQAAEMGAAAAREGKPVTSNPFPARDPRRARFDEAWCAALGTDGMDIPDAWKRAPKPKKNDALPEGKRP